MVGAEGGGLPVPTAGQLTDLVADAYAAAARGGAAMAYAVEVFEDLRANATTAADGYALLRLVDDVVLRSVGSQLLHPAQQLRDRCRALQVRIAAQALLPLQDGRVPDPATGWLRTFGITLCHYRLEVCTGLIEEAERRAWRIPLLPQVREAVDAARDDDWEPFGPLIDQLVEEDLWSEVDRARLTATSALCHLYFREDRLRARELATEIHRAHPELPETVEAAALVELVDGRRDRAEALLRPLVEAGSLHDGIHSAYADCASWEAENELAEQRLLAGLELRPVSIEILNRLIDLYSAPGFFVERRDRQSILIRQVVALDPDSTYRNRLTVVRGLRQAGELAAAEEAAERLIAEKPGRIAGYLELARVQLATQNLAACRATLDTPVVRDSRIADVAEVQALCAEAATDQQGAIEWSRRAVDWGDGLSVWAWVNLAQRELEAGEDAAAWTSALAALRRAPYDDRIPKYLVDVFAARWGAGDGGDVTAAYQEIMATGSSLTSAAMHEALAEVASAAGDDAGTVAHLLRAIEGDPERAGYRRFLAEVLRGQGRWAEALKAYEEAYARDQDRQAYEADVSRTLNERGNGAVAASRFADAAEDYEAAIALVADEPVFHANLALALDLITRPTHRAALLRRAVAALAEAHRLAPKDGYGLQLARAEEKLRRVRRFGELIERPYERHPIVVEASADLVPLLDPAQRGRGVFDETIPTMRAGLLEDVGFEFPALLLMGGALPDHEYRIRLDGALRAGGAAYDGCVWVPTSADELRERGLTDDDLIPGVDPVTGRPSTWVRTRQDGAVDLSGLTSLDPVAAIFRHVAHVLRRNASQFFTIDVAVGWIEAHTDPVVDPERDAGAGEPAGTGDGRERVQLRDRRQLATARALRGCLLRSLRLDRSLLAEVDEVLSQVGEPARGDPLHWAAAALDVLGRPSARGRSAEPGHPDADGSVAVPPWAVSLLEKGRPLPPAEEHRLLEHVRPAAAAAADRDRPVVVHSGAAVGADHLRRLLEDGFEPLYGVRVLVDAPAAAAPAVADVQPTTTEGMVPR